jgi:hypothetical protein
MHLRDITMKYGRLAVFIRHDSAEIWRFKYGLKLVIGTLLVMARTGVFVLVVCALKHSISGHGRQPSMILTYMKHKQSGNYQKNDLSKVFHQRRQRTKQKERQPRIMVD